MENQIKSEQEISKASTLAHYIGAKTGLQNVDREFVAAKIAEVTKGTGYARRDAREKMKAEEKLEKAKAAIQKALAEDDVAHQEGILQKQVDHWDETRDLEKVWIHFDMDMFYAAVEMRDNPELMNKPLAVGNRGMLATSNYLARSFGVRSAMPGFIGEALCPDLVIVPANHYKYEMIGRIIRNIVRFYDPEFESFGLDEAYLYVSPYMEANGLEGEAGAQQIAKELRDKIYEECGLTASAGIAWNKMLAKMCTDVNKPNGQYYLPPTYEAVMGFINKCGVRDVPYIGVKTEYKLKGVGIHTCEDLVREKFKVHCVFTALEYKFLVKSWMGLGDVVHGEGLAMRDMHGPGIKSVGHTISFQPTADIYEFHQLFKWFSKDISRQLVKRGAHALIVIVIFKNRNFEQKTAQKKLQNYIQTTDAIFEKACEIFRENYDNDMLRNVGISVSNLIYNLDTQIEEMFASSGKDVKKEAEYGIKPSDMVCPVCDVTFYTTEYDMARHIEKWLPPEPKKTVQLVPNPQPKTAVKKPAPTRKRRKVHADIGTMKSLNSFFTSSKMKNKS